MSRLVTPETHPNHHTVGRDFVGGADKGRYYCDSYDPSCGYWMTPRQPVGLDGEQLTRRNVSERAIGWTFHEVWMESDGREYTTSGWMDYLRRWNERYPRSQTG